MFVEQPLASPGSAKKTDGRALNLLKCTDKITENRKIQEKLIKIKHNQEEEKQEENQQNHSPFT